jgi:hypothetical protein
MKAISEGNGWELHQSCVLLLLEILVEQTLFGSRTLPGPDIRAKNQGSQLQFHARISSEWWEGESQQAPRWEKVLVL